METNTKLNGTDFAERLWRESWTHIKTVVDTAREPFLILDEHLRVMTANESFYRTFQVEEKDTEGKVVYKLGDGQWDIPSLRKLLEGILPKNTFFKGYEVAHDFPSIGRKVMILNARRIYRENTSSNLFPPIILLAMEDVTDMMVVAETLAGHANQLETKLMERIKGLEQEIDELKKRT
jgi:PAS domain-containing protein